MGAWGTALYSDDLACDVRDSYRRLVAEGSTGPEATVHLLHEWSETIADEEEGPLFWLALAATQWDCGRLEDSVKATAMEIIDNESSLGPWHENSKLLKQRRAVLDKLSKRLQSPQPGMKKIRVPAREVCDWSIGEILSYQLPSQKLTLFHLVGKHESRDGTSLPIFAILDWIGSKPPADDRIKSLPLRISPGGTSPYLFSLVRRTKKDFPIECIKWLGLRRKPHERNIRGGYRMGFWKDLNDDLKRDFKIE